MHDFQFRAKSFFFFFAPPPNAQVDPTEDFLTKIKQSKSDERGFQKPCNGLHTFMVVFGYRSYSYIPHACSFLCFFVSLAIKVKLGLLIINQFIIVGDTASSVGT